MHRGLRAVAHHHVVPAGVHPVDRAAVVENRLAARGGEVDGVRPRPVRVERDFVDRAPAEIVEGIGIDGIEASVRREAAIARDTGVRHPAGRHFNDVPMIIGATDTMQISRFIRVPPHVAGVNVVSRVVSGDPPYGRAEDRIDIARAHRQRRDKTDVGEGPGGGRGMA